MRRGLSEKERGELIFLDVGGNIGAHTIFVQAAGFSGITFELSPQNEDVIRSNLCMNDGTQKRVTLFTKGLGAAPAICTEYADQASNQGNGVVSCNNKIPELLKSHKEVSVEGKMEIVALDDLWRCTEKEIGPDGTNGDSQNNKNRDADHTSLLPQNSIGAMKMDVEGFEPEVVAGAKPFLTEARIPFIVFKVGRMTSERRQQILAFFYSLGYKSRAGSFFETLSQPEGLSNVEDAFLVLDDEQ